MYAKSTIPYYNILMRIFLTKIININCIICLQKKKFHNLLNNGYN